MMRLTDKEYDSMYYEIEEYKNTIGKLKERNAQLEKLIGQIALLLRNDILDNQDK